MLTIPQALTGKSFVTHASGRLHAIVGCLVRAMGHIVMILVNYYGPSCVALKYLVYIPIRNDVALRFEIVVHAVEAGFP